MLAPESQEQQLNCLIRADPTGEIMSLNAALYGLILSLNPISIHSALIPDFGLSEMLWYF